MDIKVLLAQFDITVGDVEKNVEKVNLIITAASKMFDKEKCNILILPEMWSCGYDLSNLEYYAQFSDDIIIELSTRAKQHKLFIATGSLPISENDAIYNTSMLIDSSGIILNRYSKIHLFGLMNEHLYMKAGSKLSCCKIGDTVLSQFICYDLRFPEAFRVLSATHGTEIFFISAQWPIPRLHHWRSLIIARAIENQAFVIAVNRTGTDDTTGFFGHSMVVNPWGDILVEANELSGIVHCDFDTKEVKAVRKKFPFLNDRVPQIYYSDCVK